MLTQSVIREMQIPAFWGGCHSMTSKMEEKKTASANVCATTVKPTGASDASSNVNLKKKKKSDSCMECSHNLRPTPQKLS